MSYIDGFVCPVKPGRKADYIAMAEMAAPLFLEYGALRVVETWNEDLMVGKDQRLPQRRDRRRRRGHRLLVDRIGPTRPRATAAGRRSWPIRA